MAKKLEMDGIRSLMEAASQMARATKDWTTWKRLFEQYESKMPKGDESIEC